jgi:phage protein D/phage baseplate assembly protein gpV
MPDEPVLSSQISIKLDGSVVDAAVMEKVLELVVDQSSLLPDMFTILLHDPSLEMLDNGPFDLTKEIEIIADKPDGEKVTLLKGEITALEPDFQEGMTAELSVRGYDKSHRLHREVKTKTFLNVKDSDIASQIAQDGGLQAQVDTTSTVYNHVFQHNQTDMEFLAQRAWRIGFESFVSEGKLHFRKPPDGDAQTTVKWGDDLLTFRPRMTLAEQVDEVIVKGWDAKKQEAIVGQAQNGKLYPKIGDSKDGAQWANTFGTGKQIIVDQPVISQAEADALAEARLNEISGAFIEADGEAFRRPDIKAGEKIKLEALGNRLSGTYLVTNATHIYSEEGLKTNFTVRGARTGQLAEQMSHRPPIERWPGVVPAVVTNTDDPQDEGRVKVKFPWMSDDAESDWARVLGIGAGPEAGFALIPDVNDEVLVAFSHGEFNKPIVLGGLWSEKNIVPPETTGASSGEKPLVRTWRSRTGHLIVMHDDSENKIEIKTAGGQSITLDDQNKEVIITGTGKMNVGAQQNITIEGQANLDIKTTGDINMESTGNMTLKGTQLTLEGTAKATLKAPTVSVEGSAMTEVKGALVKIN